MNFIQRNKSIFIFGVIIGIVFVGLIVLGWNHGGSTNLILTPFTKQDADKEKDDYTYTPPAVEKETIPEQEIAADGTSKVAEGTIKSAEDDPKKIKYRPDKIVSFTLEKGFTPMTDAVHVPQKVLWVNDSNEQITIKELVNKQTDKTPLILNPGESFEIVVNNTGYWTFKEINTGKSARLYVAPN